MGNLSKCSVSALLWIADVIDPHCERQQRVVSRPTPVNPKYHPKSPPSNLDACPSAA